MYKYNNGYCCFSGILCINDAYKIFNSSSVITGDGTYEYYNEAKEMLRKEIIKAVESGCIHFALSAESLVDKIAAEVIYEISKDYNNIFTEIFIPERWYLNLSDIKEIADKCCSVNILSESRESAYGSVILNAEKIIIATILNNIGVYTFSIDR